LEPFAADFLVDFMKDIGHVRLQNLLENAPGPIRAQRGRNLTIWRTQGKSYADNR
jgi:hypothetical protein